MPERFGRACALVLCALAASAGWARAAEASDALAATPPRLALAEGEVAFFRAGAADGAPALVNTALAAGDELHAAEGARLELQVGARAFVRARGEARLRVALEPDRIRLELRGGALVLDAAHLDAGPALEVETPHAVVRVEDGASLRVDASGDATVFIHRRGASALVVPVAGEPVALAAGARLVTSGGAPLALGAAPEPDAFEGWSEARSAAQREPASARYVASGVYGVHDLDAHGRWEVVASYGPVWFPHRTDVGWLPYGFGRWLPDPVYGWTWVDAALWGWAPFHYGRWVNVSGGWGWCPGPLVVRPAYAPALVAFRGHRFPDGGWVALGWGEPVIPWWGPASYRRRAHWLGWAGPHVVNQVVVRPDARIDANQVRIHRNAAAGGSVWLTPGGSVGLTPGASVWPAPGRSSGARLGDAPPFAPSPDLGPGRAARVAPRIPVPPPVVVSPLRPPPGR